MPTTKKSSGKAKMRRAARDEELEELRRQFPREEAEAVKEMMRSGVPAKGWSKSVMRIPVPPSPEEMRDLRRKIHMSQSEMAHLLNTPKKTYQNWEQGLRHPDGAITLLLNLLKKDPSVAKLLMEI